MWLIYAPHRSRPWSGRQSHCAVRAERSQVGTPGAEASGVVLARRLRCADEAGAIGEPGCELNYAVVGAMPVPDSAKAMKQLEPKKG
jgi:hypothetical protein